MSHIELSLQSEIKSTLMQINDIINKNIHLIRDLRKLTGVNSDIKILMDVVDSQFDLLQKKFKLPEVPEETVEPRKTASLSVELIEHSME